MKFKLWFISLIIFLSTSAHGAEWLKKVELNEDDILLLDVAINRETIASAVDAYKVNDKVLIAIEPVFDSLKLRYQLTEKQLTVWKDEEVKLFDFAIGGGAGPQDAAGLWATDGYYQFIEIELLRKVFGVNINTDLLRQMIIFSSDSQQLANLKEPPYLFPIQKLALLNERRQLNRFYNSNTGSEELTTAITIGDQYRLITPPHGRVSLAANLADKQFNGAVQLVSDFLYHSTNLTLSKSDQTDLAASMTMSRFKSSPEDRILGLFDSYFLGDISGVANNLTTASNSGLGILFQRNPDNFRRKNLEITLEELAPPGWDAELFRSGVFLGRRVVPADGRLIYENVELFYGLNDFEIRLYGPYGEEEIINNRINVKQNPLAAGEMAYTINALDKNHQMFNNTSDESYGLTNFSGSFDYGINERWQLGVAFASIDSDQQFLSVKNALSFNNFLFENDLSVNQDGSYAQQTSLTGSLFYKDNYTLRFESAKDYASETIDAKDDSLFKLSGSYSIPTYIGLTRFSAGYQESDSTNRLFVSNQLSNSLGPLYLTHTLTYSKYDLSSLSSQFNEIESLQGNLSLSANLPSFFISASLSYDPEKSDFLQDSSSITIRKTIKDPYENRHYLQAQYFPLNAAGRNWAIRHNMAMQSEKYQMTLSSSFDSNDDWSVQLGVQFFLGYDYRNNSFIMDREFSGGSATLDVHTYLDRQVNGVPDPLDFDLADVRFTGNPRWKEYRSNDQGRTILPGVYANSEFAFAANWQEGSATVNNDYVVYTHPGALVEVNMPFYLITDLTGFVVRHQSGQEIALRNVEMQLMGVNNEVIKTLDTDQDGYYEFLDLSPNAYRVRVSDEYLVNKGLTSDLIGINVATSGRGGFVELPTLILRRTDGPDDKDKEDLKTHILDEVNVDALVWSKDEELNKNYFTLPRKEQGPLRASYSFGQDKSDVVDKKSTKNEPVKAEPEFDKLNLTAEPKLAKVQQQSKVIDNPALKARVVENSLSLPKLNLRDTKAETSTAPLTSPTNTQSNKVQPGEIDLALYYVKEGWIIQFSANSSTVDEQDAIARYSAFGELYVAQKSTRDGKIFYCLVSQIFDSKTAANEALSASGFSGWITQSESFSNVKKIY
ncbi:carboxypeptidase-like regulatory domain-containing protein [Paraglaciecola sp.]|uniref:carboxypeptidase-like regulatory domain-containing protein n=1 Tax=Paraglaciecola sp. TaxID=1920173 RepID=UPI0030F3BB0E